MSEHRVDVGEYAFMAWQGRAGLVVNIFHQDNGPIGHVSADRDKAIHAMMRELDAARAVVRTARKVVSAGGGDSRIRELQDAIEHYDSEVKP